MTWTDRNLHRTAVFAAMDTSADKYRLEPLTVTAELGSALAVTRPHDLSLDGILAYEMLHTAFDGDLSCLPNIREAPLFCRLPLAIQGIPVMVARVRDWRWGRALRPDDDLIDQPWWYAVSTPRLIDTVASGTDYWNKRFDTQHVRHLDDDVKTVVIEKGTFKAYHQMLPTVTCRAVQWSVMGDREVLAQVLASVDYLSKKRSYGYGAVLRWQVEPVSQDESLWEADGTLARPVPLNALVALGLTDMSHDAWHKLPGRAYIAYRAPQWLDCNQAFCLIGGRRRLGEMV